MASQINILEELKNRFDELKNQIESTQNEINNFKEVIENYNNQIKNVEERRDEVNIKLNKKVERLEQLENIYQTTEDNFNQVQAAAQSLLDIINTKNEEETMIEEN